MLSFLPAPLLLLISLPLAVVNIAFWAPLVTCFIPLKLVPNQSIQQQASRLANGCFYCWVEINRGIFALVNDMQWEIEGDLDQLSRKHWYLLLSNHRSWVDIPILTLAFNRRIPELKFFLKRELIWVPFVGLGAWAMDMPFMRRFTPQQLKKKPHLKGEDIKATRRSCEKFQHVPCSVINFVEGTRYTPQKHAQRESPFQYLLRPKAGGIAFALAAMGERFDQVLCVTLCYPDNQGGSAMLDLMCGRMKRVKVHIEAIDMQDVPQGNYSEDPMFRAEFQRWLNGVWERTDAKLVSWLRAS